MEEEKTYPIRLMFGIGNNIWQGFSVVYEDYDEKAHKINIWYEDELFDKVSFVDGESSVTFTTRTTPAKKRFFTGTKKTEWVVKSIKISRDWFNKKR